MSLGACARTLPAMLRAQVRHDTLNIMIVFRAIHHMNRAIYHMSRAISESYYLFTAIPVFWV